MILKKEEHRKFLMELLNQVAIPGNLVELAYEVRQEVKSATLSPDEPAADEPAADDSQE